jgi:uncharacterized protein
MSTRAEAGYVPSGVWRIRGTEKTRTTVYLAGASHVVPEEQAPFPSPFYAAYEDSEVVYIEAESELSMFSTMLLLPRVYRLIRAHSESMVAPKGKTLSDYLSREILEELRLRYGKDLSEERMTPVSLLFQSEGGFLNENGMASGVEEPFRLMAQRDGKRLRELDDAEVKKLAVALLDRAITMHEEEVARSGADAAVRKALLSEETPDHSAWRHGNMEPVLKDIAKIKAEVPEFYEKLLPERNRRWMVEIERLLRGRKNALVLVGVDHLGGEKGLLNLLMEAGYQPEQLYGIDRPEVGAATR